MYIHPAMSYNVYTSSNKCIKVLVSLQYGAIRDNDLAISPYYVIYTYVYMYICIHIHNMYYIDGTYADIKRSPSGASRPRASRFISAYVPIGRDVSNTCMYTYTQHIMYDESYIFGHEMVQLYSPVEI